MAESAGELEHHLIICASKVGMKGKLLMTEILTMGIQIPTIRLMTMRTWKQLEFKPLAHVGNGSHDITLYGTLPLDTSPILREIRRSVNDEKNSPDTCSGAASNSKKHQR